VRCTQALTHFTQKEEEVPPIPIPPDQTSHTIMSTMNMQTMEQRIDPDNDVNIFLTAFIFMTMDGFHEEANQSKRRAEERSLPPR
jgi:hypothetical protein